jgi:nucleoside-triphosphatase THEP1
MEHQKNMAVRVGADAAKPRLIKKLVSRYGYWLGGFFTEELRPAGAREGFLLRTPGGGSELLASKNVLSPAVFNKYGVSLQALDGLGVRSLAEARRDGKIILLDELGPLVLLSDKLAALALEALAAGDAPCLATFRKGAKRFEDAFVKMDNTTVLDLNGRTAAGVQAALYGWIEFWIEKLGGR